MMDVELIIGFSIIITIATILVIVNEKLKKWYFKKYEEQK